MLPVVVSSYRLPEGAASRFPHHCADDTAGKELTRNVTNKAIENVDLSVGPVAFEHQD